MKMHTSRQRRSCPHAAISIAFLAIAAVTTAKAYPLFAEDKRQGLIPFPRVGRSPFSVDSPNDVDEVYSDDPLALLYTRALFNPRLGRKKRSVQDSDSFDSLDLEELGELLRQTPWSLVGYKDNNDKKNQMAPGDRRANMAPRLGRKRSDGSLVLESDMETNKRGPHAPSAASFSPRLGRSSYDLSDLERSSPQPNFNPRLGRAATNTNFSPRLGRSVNSEDSKMA